jgi:hypothetical protein
VTGWRSFYDSIELTPEEIEAALFEARVKKYFREKHKAYWEEQENGMQGMRKSKSRKPGSDVMRIVQPITKED